MLRTDSFPPACKSSRKNASRHDARSPIVSPCKTLSREERWGGADVSRYHVYPNVWGATCERRCAPLQPCCARVGDMRNAAVQNSEALAHGNAAQTASGYQLYATSKTSPDFRPPGGRVFRTANHRPQLANGAPSGSGNRTSNIYH